MQLKKHSMIKRMMIVFGVIIPLVFGSLFVPSFADEPADDKFDLKIELLAVLGLSPREAEVLPTYVTRAEFVKKLAALSGLYDENMPQTESIALPYADVTADSDCYSAIQLCYGLGIIGDTSKFRPDEKITLAEAAEMTASLLGYSKWVTQRMPMKLIVKRLKLTDCVESGSDGCLTGRGMVQLLHNALFTEVLETSGIYSRGSVVYERGDTLLKQAFDINVSKGVVDSNPITSLYSKSGCGYGRITLDGAVYTADESAYDFIGHRADIYWRDNNGTRETVLIQDSPETKTFVIEFGDIDKLLEKSVSYENEKGSKIEKSFVNSAPFLYNGKLRSFSDIDQTKITDGYVEFIDNDDNGVYDCIMITSLKHIRVNAADSRCSTVYGSKSGDVCVLEEKENERHVIIEKNGGRVGFDEIKTGSVISVAESEKVGTALVRAYISETSVQGSIMKIKDDEITVGDSVYEYVGEMSALRLGMYGTFYIAYNGKIADAAIENYSVYGYLYRMSNDDFGRVKVKIYSEKDRWVELSADSRVTYNGSRVNAVDLFSKAELFSGGEIKPQLVSYRVNKENELTALTTAKTVEWGSSEDDAARENGDFRLSKKADSLTYRSGTNSFNHEVYLSAASPVFVVPGSFGDKSIDMNEIYIASSGNFESDKIYSNLYFYDMTEGGMASAAVIYGGSVAAELETIFPVAELGFGLDKEGERLAMIEVYVQGTPVEMLADNSCDLSASGIKKGDVVKLTMKQSGRITKAELVYRPTDSSYDNKVINGVHNTKTMISGTVKYVNAAEKRVVVNYGSGTVIFGLANLQTAYRYSPERETYRLTDMSELAVGKKVFLRASYGRIYDLIVFE